MLTRLRTGTTNPLDRARLALVEQVGRPTTASRRGQALAPLCILAVGAAFFAEVATPIDPTAVGALAVVPVMASAMLRARSLTLIVVAFAMVLQVWGVAAGVVPRDAAGVQISVYLLTLALAALQQSRPAAAARHDAEASEGDQAEDPEDAESEHVSAVIRVNAAPVQHVGVGVALPDVCAQQLTPRERDVVVLAVQGCTAREIGRRLFIGERTVETHLGNAYGKLGVRSKMELVRVVAHHRGDPADFRTDTEASRRATA